MPSVSFTLCQIFGSKQTGPYFNSELINHENKNIINTADRIPMALQKYQETFPNQSIDVILLNTVIWDHHRMVLVLPNDELRSFASTPGHPLYVEILQTFRHDVNRLIQNTIQLLLQQQAYKRKLPVLGLRTQYYYNPTHFLKPGPLLDAMNDVIRDLAADY